MRVVSDQVEQELAKGVEATRVRDAAAIICEALDFSKGQCSSVRADIVYLLERGEVVCKGGAYKLLSAEELRTLSRRRSGRWGDSDRKSRTEGRRHRRVNAPGHSRRRRDEPPVPRREYVAAPSHNEDDAWWNALSPERKRQVRLSQSPGFDSRGPREEFVARVEGEFAKLCQGSANTSRILTATGVLRFVWSCYDDRSSEEVPVGTADETAELDQVYGCGHLV